MKEHNYLEIAKEYLKNGLSVIPLKPNEKLPLVQWQEYTKRHPTVEEVTKWWTDTPNANIGVVTGRVSNLTVVDFDKKDGMLPFEYKAFPKTKAVLTTSKGYHFYYRYSDKVHTCTDVFQNKGGVDIRNDGGYVVAPPSVVNESQYALGRAGVIEEFPIQMFENIKPIEANKKQLNDLVAVSSGGRNDSMARLIGKLLKTTKEDKWNAEIWPVILQINQTYTPPLDIEELKTTYSSICRKEKSSQINSPNSDLNDFVNSQDIGELLKNMDDEKAKSAFLQGLATYSGEDEMVSTDEIVKMIEKEGELEKFYTGWSGLDSIVGGFTPGQLVVLSAPTKNGKTSLAMDMTSRMKEQAPAWFPFEEGAQELVHKYLERKEKPPMFFTPKAMIDNHVDWIERKIVESLVKYKSRVFIIDHLHFIVPPSSNNMSQQIGLTMRQLKNIAKTWNVVIVLIAHLKKTKLDEAPDLEDLRDSSFIAQEADTVIMLWRKALRENKQVVITNNVVVSVQANRRTGRTGNVKFTFKDGHFLEEDWEDTDFSGDF